MRGRILAVLVVAVASLLAVPAPARATTAVTVKGNDVTIKVVVDCIGCKGKKSPDGKQSLAEYWKETAQKAWNAAFDEFSYCNKYKLRLEVDIAARSAGAAARKGRHGLQAGTAGSGYTQAGWGGAPEATPGGDPAQRSPDGTRYFTNDGDGLMPEDATPTVIIHEFGHVIGLGDDRDDSGNALPGREKTVMVGGARLPDGTVISPDAKLKVDKQLVDRIGDQLANLNKIKCGETWQGSITGTGENVGACPQNIDFSGDFTIRVRPDDSAALNGRIRNVNNGACGGGGESFETDFRLDGSKTSRALRFTETALLPWAVDLRISGDRATGTIAKMFGPVYLTNLDFTARRAEEDRAVG